MRIAAPSLELNAVTGNDPAKIDKVSRQLEGQFAQMLIKSMRAASFGDSLFPGENQMFREMYDQRIAEAMTKGRGLGLSSMIARQLGGADKAAQPLDTSLVPAAKAAQAYRLLAPAPATTAPMALPAPQAALQADPLQAVAASAPAMPQEQMLDLIAGRDSGSLHAAIGGRGTAPEAAPATADWALANDRWSGVGPAAPRSDGVDVATANAAADQLGKHTPEGFVASIWPHAEKAARELGVDPRARPGRRTRSRGVRGDQHPRLLPRVGDVDATEVATQHVVHRRGHVLDHAAREDPHVRASPPRDRLGDLVQRVERTRQPQQNDLRAGEQRLVETERDVRVGQAEPLGVRGERPLPGQRILVGTDAADAVPRGGAQGQRPVPVADHGEPSGGRRAERVGGLVQEEPIGGVRCVQVLGLDVGPPRQRREVEVHAPHARRCVLVALCSRMGG